MLRLTRTGPLRAVAASASTSKQNTYTSTLKLPKTSFPARPDPSVSASTCLAVSSELYAWQSSHRPSTTPAGTSNTFVLHDGPPYANGPLHTGHLLNKILKDMIVRTHLARGKQIVFRPGWDCHGLPIELKALQAGQVSPTKKGSPTSAATDLSALQVRDVARQLARQTVDEHESVFRSWGILADWDRPYLTMLPDYVRRQLGVFKEMVANGLIYRQFRPVHWSPSSQSALAEAELEYDDNHRVTAAFVKFPLLKSALHAVDASQSSAETVYALIWTTTPWTLPANMAIAVRRDLEYSLVRVQDKSNTHPGHYVVATERLQALKAYLPEDTIIEVTRSLTGEALLDSTYHNPLSGEACRIVHADFVTSSTGTGLVHMAPGHGMDDYITLAGLGYTQIKAPVDHLGRYTDAALPHCPQLLSGLDVQTKGAQAVLRLLESPSPDNLPPSPVSLSSLVLAAHDFRHKNPIDWRTKQPVIVRATEQWFASVGKLMKPATEALDEVRFIPDALRTKLVDHVHGRAQWCISRQRAWGVPIPALFKDGQAVLTPESIDHIASVIETRGVDAWWSDPVDDPAWVSPSLGPGNFVRGKDTMDVWFDSGSSWASLDAASGPPTVVEGTDQHRGWFQSSLLTKIATQLGAEHDKPSAPYSTVVTHAFILDQHGRKMSKSLGNVISPVEILTGSIFSHMPSKGGKKPAALGPDVLHLWVASNDYTKDVSLGPTLVQYVHQNLQKYRVTFKWLLGVLDDYPYAGPRTRCLSSTPNMTDRIVLHQLAKTSSAVFDAQDDYMFYKAVNQINRFINVDLSAGYFEVVKDRIYAGDEASRRHTQTVLYTIMDHLLVMLAPITPLLVQEVYDHLPEHHRRDRESPLKRVATRFTSPYVKISPRQLENNMTWLQSLSTAIKSAQEAARRAGHVGSGLACSVEIQLPTDAPHGFAEMVRRMASRDELRETFVVSGVSITPRDERARKELEDAITDPEAKEAVREYRSWRAKVPWSCGAEYSISKDSHGWIDSDQVDAGKVVVLPARGGKCARCWQYTAQAEEEICDRCYDVINAAEIGASGGADLLDTLFDGISNPDMPSHGGRRRPKRRAR